MPRRKQARPRKIGEQPPDTAGSPQDIPGDRDGEMSSKRNEETKMCEECCANFFVLSEFREHQKNCTENPPVLTINDSEGTVPTESFPEAPLGTFPRDRMDGRARKDIQAEGCTGSMENREGKMNGEAVGGMYPKIDPPLRPAAPSLSYPPQPEAPNTFDAVSFSVTSLHTISMVLEWLMCMFQQYFQLLMELIRIQTALVAPPALPPSTDPLTALGATVSPQLLAAVPLIRQNAGSQSLPLEPLEQGKLPHSNPGIAASSSLEAGLSSSFPLMPEESQDLPGSVSQFLNPLLPQSSSSVIFQNPLSAVSSVMDSSRKGQGKPPNTSVSESPDAEEPSFKHECKFCGKVFGNSSALQIHLRSHTPGERFYQCIICGNHFTTKGNFKVHVEDHKDEYSHMKMNPHPVPEPLDNVPASTGIPCGMSVPLDESNLIVGSKPLLTPLPASGVPQSISSLAGIQESLPGTFSSELQSRPSPKIEGGSSSSGAVGHESGTEQSLSSPQAACNVSIFLISGQNEQGSETSKSQQLVENTNKSTADPNECLICHRVLSCPSSLRMHYRTHTGERPFKCRICSRAFSTKGNLKAHQGVHRANAPSKVQHSCPICQKKFANAVVLQQHIRMHMGGQIPNTPVPEPPCDSPEVDPEKNRGRGDGEPEKTCPEEMVESIDMENDVGSQHGPRGSSKARALYNAQSESPSAFPGVTALQNQVKIVTSSLNLQQQSSLNSSENGSAEGDGMAMDSSSVVGDAECQHSQSPSEAAALQALSPANSHLSSKSPAFNSQEDSGRRGKSEHPKNAPAEMEGVVGALDLMYGIGNVIKEEPGLLSANGECGGSSIPAAFVRAPPALVKMELPGAGPLSTGHFTDPAAPSPGVTPVLVPRPRSCRPSKVHTCPTCGKTFPCASALQIHKRSHTGEKPFACTICGKAFTTKGNLKIHGRTHLWRSSGTQGRWVSLDNPLGAQEGVGDVPQGCVGALGEHRPRRVRGRAQLRAGPADQGGLGGPEQGPAPAHGWGSPLNPPHNLQGGHNPGWQHP